MRGSPFWQVLAVVIAFAAMALPVWRLTRPAEAVPVDAAAGLRERAGQREKAVAPLTMDVEADFAPAPTEFSLSYLGTPVLQGKALATAKAQTNAAVPADGADLVLRVVWPAGADQTGGGAPAAARVVVSLSDGRQVEKSFWSGDGATLDTVLSVPGKAAEAAP